MNLVYNTVLDSYPVLHVLQAQKATRILNMVCFLGLYVRFMFGIKITKNTTKAPRIGLIRTIFHLKK